MPRDPFFNTRAAEIAANILAAHCQDLCLSQIEQYANGHVSAMIGTTTFEFEWDVQTQSVNLVHRYDPNLITAVAA